MQRLLPEIAGWIREAHAARQVAGEQWGISHSDLDQKNVLWSDQKTPWLIDWEAAGWVQPAIEAVGAALDWSGSVSGDFHAASYAAFLGGYRREKPLTAEEEQLGGASLLWKLVRLAEIQYAAFTGPGEL